MNCLQFALRFWNDNRNYKIFYNSDHVINLEQCEQTDYLPLEEFGFKNIYNSFRQILTKNDIQLLKKYFNIYGNNKNKKTVTKTNPILVVNQTINSTKTSLQKSNSTLKTNNQISSVEVLKKLMTSMYIYRAKVVSAYDGDTIRVFVDLGFGVTLKGSDGKGEQLRLFGINAPEMRGIEKVEGRKSRDFLRKKVLGKNIIILTYKDAKGKFGRYLAAIYLIEKIDGVEVATSINDLMVKNGL